MDEPDWERMDAWMAELHGKLDEAVAEPLTLARLLEPSEMPISHALIGLCQDTTLTEQLLGHPAPWYRRLLPRRWRKPSPVTGGSVVYRPTPPRD